MTYHITPAKLHHYIHLIQLGMREWDIKAIAAFTSYGSDLEAWAAETYRACLTQWALINEAGDVVGIAGVILEHDGVLSIWAVGTDEIYKTKEVWTPFLDHHIDDLFKHTKTHRIEAYVMEGFEGAERTMRYLRFEFEGVRRAYGVNRENALLYSKVKP